MMNADSILAIKSARAGAGRKDRCVRAGVCLAVVSTTAMTSTRNRAASGANRVPG